MLYDVRRGRSQRSLMNLHRLPLSSTDPRGSTNALLPSVQIPGSQISRSDKHHLNDFLTLHDQDFVGAAYRGLLERDADPAGCAHYLDSLRAGRLSKVEILGRLRYSPEGRQKKVPVKGLLLAFLAQRAYRVPIVGGIFALVAMPANLPRMQSRLEEVDVRLRAAEKSIALLERRAANARSSAVTATVEIPDIPANYIVSDVDAALQELWDLTRTEA
jgi:hypothetical protein